MVSIARQVNMDGIAEKRIYLRQIDKASHSGNLFFAFDLDGRTILIERI